MLTDLHLHSCVSDGDLDPGEVLQEAAKCGIARLSIADHDSLGAYSWDGGRVLSLAQALGLDLIVGVELDATIDDQEVHLLGYEVRLDAASLAEHLAQVKIARLERARREITLVIERLGSTAIEASEVFRPGRETFMRPHFIHPMLERRLFPNYEEANAWFKANVQSGIAVPKPSIEEAIRLVREAGGWTCLAHPGYYDKAGKGIAEELAALKRCGLDGVEVEYPYHACSPRLFDSKAAESVCVESIRRAGEALGLRLTRGSDCHTRRDFEKVYGETPPVPESR